jgi:hypothetical protein
VLALSALGAWRTIARGRSQLRDGMPSAWVVSLAAAVAFVSLLVRPHYDPAASPAGLPTLSDGPITLVALSLGLSVFLVVDLFQALINRLALPAPPTGPSDVPRVRAEKK